MPKKYILITLLLISTIGLVFLFVSRNKNLTINLDFNKSDENLKYLWNGLYDVDSAVYNIGTSKDSQELLKGIVKYWRVSVGRWEVQTTKQQIDAKISEKNREFFTGKTLEDAQNPKFYNWTYLDKVLNEVEALGAKPLIDFDSMPKSLAKNNGEDFSANKEFGLEIPYEWSNNIKNSPPENAQTYAEVIKHILMHYKEGWANGYYKDYDLVEIGNEPELKIFWNGAEEEYLKTYETAARNIKNHFGDKIKIGGGAFAGKDLTGKFITYNLENNIPMDFVSFHQYASPKNTPDDFKYIKELTALIKKKTEEKNRNIEIFLDEWGPNLDTWVTKNPYNASLDNIDYVLFEGSVYSLLENTDLTMSFKTLIIDRPNKLNRGLITYHPSKPKPVYYLYQALKKFDETPIKLKTIEESDIYGIIAKGENKINILLVNNNDNNKEINIEINNLQRSFKTIKKYELTQDSFDKGEGLKFIEEKNLDNEKISESLKSESVSLIEVN